MSADAKTNIKQEIKDLVLILQIFIGSTFKKLEIKYKKGVFFMDSFDISIPLILILPLKWYYFLSVLIQNLFPVIQNLFPSSLKYVAILQVTFITIYLLLEFLFCLTCVYLTLSLTSVFRNLFLSSYVNIHVNFVGNFLYTMVGRHMEVF